MTGLLVAILVVQSLSLLVQLSQYGLFTQLAGRR